MADLTITRGARLAGWTCYHCGHHFIHARFLVTHLIDLHGEGAAA